MTKDEIRAIVADEIKKNLKIEAAAGQRKNWHGNGFPAVQVELRWQTRPPDPNKKHDYGEHEVIAKGGDSSMD